MCFGTNLFFGPSFSRGNENALVKNDPKHGRAGGWLARHGTSIRWASLLAWMFGHVHRAMCSGGCQFEVLEERVGHIGGSANLDNCNQQVTGLPHLCATSDGYMLAGLVLSPFRILFLCVER